MAIKDSSPNLLKQILKKSRDLLKFTWIASCGAEVF